MKYTSKEEELKYAYFEMESLKRVMKMGINWRGIKYCKNEISRLKMKINKLKFQLWLF